MRELSRVLDRLRLEHSLTIISVEPYPTDSSHSDFWIARTPETELLIRYTRDTVLAAVEEPLTNEFAVMELAAGHDLCPRPVLADQNNGFFVRDYVSGIAGTAWSAAALGACAKAVHMLNQIDVTAARIAECHVDPVTDVLNSIGLARAAMSALRDCADERTARARKIGQDLLSVAARTIRLLRETAWPGEDLVLNHNDMAPDNLITSAGRTVIIDFETAGISPREFGPAQLIVDTQIADYNASEPIRSVDEVATVVGRHLIIPDKAILLARIAERLVQNCAYGLHQFARLSHVSRFRAYTDIKLNVSDYSLRSLTTILSG